MERAECIARAERELDKARRTLEHGERHGAPQKDLWHMRRTVEYREAVMEALSRADNTDHLRRATEMVPLTIDQLLGMDGQPVWLKVGGGEWGIVDATDNSVIMSAYRAIDIRVLKGLVYRYPTVATDTDVGSTLKEWEPCDECRNKCCFNCLYDNLSMQSEPCNSCDGDKWETKHLFCPNCGRPLTPEACAMQEKRFRGRK